MTSSVQLQPGYILHSRPYRDTSLLLEVLTAEHGRLSLVGKGARRRSRGGSSVALLQPFQPLLVSFGGRGELKNLHGVESAGPAHPLRGERLYSGLYLNELLVRLLHRHDPHPRLFAAYSEALRELADSGGGELVLRRFELQLLDELGYSFALTIDGYSGESVAEEQWYHYHPEHGMVAAQRVADPAHPSYRGAELLRMAEGELGGELRLTARRLMRQALASHLGEAPLKSRDLFRHARASGSARGGE